MTITLTPENIGHARAYVRDLLDGAHWSGSQVGSSLSEATGYAGRITGGNADADVHAELASHNVTGSDSPLALDAFASWLESRGYQSPDVTPEPEEEDTTLPAEFSAYHPSMLPMMRRAAEIANREGYCGVYDRIASEVGAPTRQEILDMDATDYVVRIPITFPVTVNVRAGSEQDAKIRAEREIGGSWLTVRDALIDSLRNSEGDYTGFGARQSGYGARENYSAERVES